MTYKFYGTPNEQVYNSDDHSLVLRFDENGIAEYNGENESILQRLKIHFKHEEIEEATQVIEEVKEQPKSTNRRKTK